MSFSRNLPTIQYFNDSVYKFGIYKHWKINAHILICEVIHVP